MAAICLDASSFQRGVPSVSELASLAIDVAYVAGTTARLLGRAHVLGDDAVVMQLGVCEQVAWAFAVACERSLLPGRAVLAQRSRDCASSCAELRDRLDGSEPGTAAAAS